MSDDAFVWRNAVNAEWERARHDVVNVDRYDVTGELKAVKDDTLRPSAMCLHLSKSLTSTTGYQPVSAP